MIILDTDILIDFLRKYPPAIEWLTSLEEEEIVLPGYVVMELVQGCANKSYLRELEKFISGFDLIWPSSKERDNALELLVKYRLSHGLGLLDALIGQTALSMDLPLHTFNRKHYEAIPDLVTIQPYQKRRPD